MKSDLLRNPPDLKLLLSIVALVAFGLLMLLSASSVIGLDFQGDPQYYFKHQLINGVLPGFVFMLIAMIVPYEFWKKLVLPLIVCSLVLLFLVFVPGVGTAYNGASRWIAVGPITLQPSEIAKIAMVLYLALLFANRKKDSGLESAFKPFAVIVVLLALLIMKQPDLGTLMVVFLTAIMIYFMAGAKIKSMAALLLVTALAAATFIVISPYRTARVEIFLDPEKDPSGTGYQVNQAIMAVGSGGIWGFGFGQSRQKFRYLPEPAGDSIFAVTAEELGFVRMTGFILLYGFMVFRGFRVASRAPDEFSRLVAGGITSWFLVQMLVHAGANVALIPLTGVPLPFVSYGGTALAISLFSVGIVLGISREASD